MWRTIRFLLHQLQVLCIDRYDKYVLSWCRTCAAALLLSSSAWHLSLLIITSLLPLLLLPLLLLLLLLPLQVSQVVIAYADWQMRREDPRFPVGQARLEAIGVLACEGFRVLQL